MLGVLVGRHDRKGGYWCQAGRGQGCWWTPYRAQNGPLNRELPGPKCQQCPGLKPWWEARLSSSRTFCDNVRVPWLYHLIGPPTENHTWLWGTREVAGATEDLNF